MFCGMFLLCACMCAVPPETEEWTRWPNLKIKSTVSWWPVRVLCQSIRYWYICSYRPRSLSVQNMSAFAEVPLLALLLGLLVAMSGHLTCSQWLYTKISMSIIAQNRTLRRTLNSPVFRMLFNALSCRAAMLVSAIRLTFSCNMLKFVEWCVWCWTNELLYERFLPMLLSWPVCASTYFNLMSCSCARAFDWLPKTDRLLLELHYAIDRRVSPIDGA